MATTIEADLERYIAATSEQVRMWSFGPVKRRLRPFEHRDEWTQVRGTLWDQGIFGPIEDYRCACGRFAGQEYSGAQCPICDVKAMWKMGRRFRFGHINLAQPIPHPFFAEADSVDAIPVIPAHYWDDPKHPALADAYEEMLHQALIEAPQEELVGAFGVILAHVEQLYEHAPAWDPYQGERLARGMLLVPDPDHVEPGSEAAEFTDSPPDDFDWDNIKLAD